MNVHRIPLAGAIALVALLFAPAASHGAWPGTPGKIAFLDREAAGVPLKVFTPAGTGAGGTHVTVRENTYTPANSDGKTPTTGFMSAPAWSPDGTRLAFAAQVDDPGMPGDVTHMAIFVWDWKMKTTTQVTTPPPGLVVPGSPQVGHQLTDYAPAWSPDGQSIAFVRMIHANPEDALASQEGGNIRIVSLTGSGSRQVTHMYGEQAFFALSWGGDPDGETHLVGRYGTVAGGGFKMYDVDPQSGTTTMLLDGFEAAAVTDFDVMPDGQALAYRSISSGAHLLGFDGASSQSLGTDFTGTDLRASPTGNGVLHIGAAQVPGYDRRAGIVERHKTDPTGDRWAEDPKDRWINGKTLLTGAAHPATPGRSTWDIQAQRLPIINIPGFAGSTIECGTERLWAPAWTGNAERLNAMRLAPDGTTNAGCPTAGPTIDPNAEHGFVNEALGLPIYQAQDEFIEQIAPGERGWRFSWDWRKAPGESLARLHAFIDHILNTDLATSQGVQKVVLYGHSYGGLLMRQYTKAHPEKVQRVLTAGTPFWGAPKSLFFLSFGVENPLSGVADLDTFLPNAEAKAWASSAPGLYHLIPSDNFGQWLRVGPDDQDQTGVRNWYTGVAGINGTLIDQARAWHQQFDGFSTEQGLVENHAVISTGLMTIGGIDMAPAPDENGDLSAIIRMVDGDVTVPATSASQGPLGSHTPLGDPVHVQATCRIPHMDLGGERRVTEPYTEYLLQGRTPRKTEGACKPDGSTIRITKQDPTPLTREAKPEADGPMTLRAASDAGVLQLVELPGAPVAVLDDHRPVDVTLGRNVSFEITKYVDGKPSSTRTYTDVAGDARLTTGSDGSAQVSVDGKPVAPDADSEPKPEPKPEPQPEPQPSPSRSPSRRRTRSPSRRRRARSPRPRSRSPRTRFRPPAPPPRPRRRPRTTLRSARRRPSRAPPAHRA